jgi:hypothetical protein
MSDSALSDSEQPDVMKEEDLAYPEDLGYSDKKRPVDETQPIKVVEKKPAAKAVPAQESGLGRITKIGAVVYMAIGMGMCICCFLTTFVLPMLLKIWGLLTY